MKKIFNFRPVCLLFMSFVLGVAITLSFFMHKYWLGVVLIVLLGLSIASGILRYKKQMLTKLFCGLLLVAFLFGVGTTCITSEAYTNRNIPNGNYQISGRITQCMGATQNGNYNYYLLEGVEVAGIHLSGRATCFINTKYDYGFNVGDRIICTANVDTLKLNDVAGYSSYRNNVKANLFVNDYVTVTVKSDRTISESVKIRIEKTLNANMNERPASIFYAMITGDTTRLDDDVNMTFRNVGIAHLLAVSGLHIGFLVLLLNHVLGLFKMKKVVHFSIISVLLFLYAFFCGFTPSVTRAMIMAIIALFAKLIGRQYDGISSLCLAGLVILLFKPLYILDRGFLLSFFAVFAILTLMPVIEDCLKRLFNKGISSAIALVLSAQLGILPLCILFFNNLSLLTVLANMVLVPLASLAYMLVFAMLVIVTIIPSAGIILQMPAFLIEGVFVVAGFFGKIGLSAVNIGSQGIMAVPYYSALPLCGDLSFIERRRKWWLFASAIAVYFLLILIYNLV